MRRWNRDKRVDVNEHVEFQRELRLLELDVRGLVVEHDIRVLDKQHRRERVVDS